MCASSSVIISTLLSGLNTGGNVQHNIWAVLSDALCKARCAEALEGVSTLSSGVAHTLAPQASSDTGNVRGTASSTKRVWREADAQTDVTCETRIFWTLKSAS